MSKDLGLIGLIYLPWSFYNIVIIEVDLFKDSLYLLKLRL